MTTSLEDINPGNQISVDNDNESQLVNEILNEMNHTDTQIQHQQQPSMDQIKMENEPNKPVNFLQHQMDPNIDMSNLDLSMASQQNVKSNDSIPVKNHYLY